MRACSWESLLLVLTYATGLYCNDTCGSDCAVLSIICYIYCIMMLLLLAGHSTHGDVQRRMQRICTFTAVKPGSSRAKRVSHTLCRRGWLLLLARKTGISLCRCFSAKNAAAAGAARSLGLSGLLKYPLGGGLASAGSSLTSCRRGLGRDGHRCKASSKACR